MNIGQKVVCINNEFPPIKKYGGVFNNAKIKPSLREIIMIDDVLGDFLRFEKYDTSESYNWWYYDNFALIDVAYYHFEFFTLIVQPTTCVPTTILTVPSHLKFIGFIVPPLISIEF